MATEYKKLFMRVGRLKSYSTNQIENHFFTISLTILKKIYYNNNNYY